MKTLRLSFASLLLLAACAWPCAAQEFTLEQVLCSPFHDNVHDFLLKEQKR